MDRVYQAGAVGIAPTAPVSPSTGYPTAGNPVGGTPATQPGPWWFHMIVEELRALIVAGGLTPDHATLNQVLQALPAALASRPEMARSITSSGYQRLPGGLILQWGNTTTNASGVATVTFPLAFGTCFIALAADAEATAANVGYGGVSYNNTTLTLTFARNAAAVNIGSCVWFALGI